MTGRVTVGISRLALLLAVLGLAGCGDGDITEPDPDPVVTWTAEELVLLSELAIDLLPPLGPDPSNQVGDDPRAVALGEQLFADTRLSGDGAVSCATCHVANQQFQDGLPLAQGVGTTARRTMTVVATAHNTWQFWDGRRDSQWSQALAPLESAVEHGTTRLGVVRVIADHYAAEYEALFGELPDLSGLPPQAGPVADATWTAAWAAMSAEQQDAVNQAFANAGKAIAAFERGITYGPSRFDRYVIAVAGNLDPAEHDRLTPDERAGARLFVGKGRCIECHTGPLLTDQRFHNIGVPPAAGLPPDEGRWAGARAVVDDPFNCLGPYSDASPQECAALQQLPTDDPATLGAFKTPSLRNVAERAPYMHAGQQATLMHVMEHYNVAPAAAIGTSELVPLNLTTREREQLVAFMGALTGEVVVRR